MAGRLYVEVPSCEGSDSSLSSKPCFAQRCFVLWMQPMSSWHSLLTHYIDMLTHYESHWVCQNTFTNLSKALGSPLIDAIAVRYIEIPESPAFGHCCIHCKQCICNVCSRDTWVPCFIFDSSLIHLWFIFDSSWLLSVSVSITLHSWEFNSVLRSSTI